MHITKTSVDYSKAIKQQPKSPGSRQEIKAAWQWAAFPANGNIQGQQFLSPAIATHGE